MPKGSLNVSLKGADDIFSTEESRQEQQREQVQQIPIGELFPFKNHPFKVLDDESMQRTVESVEQYGVLSPLIARPRPEGGYEIISGHRRQHAAQLAGLDALPVIVRQMDDDAAVLLMVDSNLQRENILPSERAFAYKMKLEALKNQGARSDLTSRQVGEKLWSVSQVGADANESERQVHRSTRYYVDEFHLLLKEEQTAAYSVEIWKRFRKWGGIPTGLTQNCKDLLSSPEVSNIFENSDMIIMLNQANGDRQILAKQLNISPHQLSYVTHSGSGEGLLFYGNTILPFVDHFPHDLELYKIMTTKLSEVTGAEKHE